MSKTSSISKLASQKMGINKGIDNQPQKYFTEDTMLFIKHQKLDIRLSQKKPKMPFPYIVNRKFVQEKKIVFGNCAVGKTNSPKIQTELDCSNRIVLHDAFVIKS